MDDHQHHTIDKSNNTPEYFKFAGVISLVLLGSIIFAVYTDVSFIDSFMGVFFVVFAFFKLINLKEFAYGFQSYDLVARKYLAYSFTYPFIQLVFGGLYLLGFGTVLLDAVVVFVSFLSGAGVLRTLGSGAKVHCVCLGNVIKLPLSTISFVEDFGMAAMALAMLITR